MKKKTIILYEDHSFLFFQKDVDTIIPDFQDNIEQGTMSFFSQLNYDNLLYPCHFIDDAIFGVCALAKNKSKANQFAQFVDQGEIQFHYRCFVFNPLSYKGTIQLEYPLQWTGSKSMVSNQGEYCQTNVSIIKQYQNFSELELSLLYHKKDQVCVHLSFQGTPIVGDKKYGFKKNVYLSQMKKHKYKMSHRKAEKALVQNPLLMLYKIEFLSSVFGFHTVYIQNEDKNYRNFRTKLQKYNYIPEEKWLE